MNECASVRIVENCVLVTYMVPVMFYGCERSSGKYVNVDSLLQIFHSLV